MYFLLLGLVRLPDCLAEGPDQKEMIRSARLHGLLLGSTGQDHQARPSAVVVLPWQVERKREKTG